MTSKQKTAEIKQLLRDTFSQFKSLTDKELTPKLLRKFFETNTPEEVYDTYDLNDRKIFWTEIESLIFDNLEIWAGNSQTKQEKPRTFNGHYVGY